MKIKLIALLIIFYLNGSAQQVRCSDLRIGKTYVIKGIKEKDPFASQAKATVTIINIKQGYIQYCWHYDYKRKNITTFSRDCEGFIEMVNRN